MKKNTEKISSAFPLLWISLLFVYVNPTQGQQVQKISPQAQTGSFEFSGMIGHNGKHPGIPLKSIPEKQLIAEFSFFGGDSLNGFDILKEMKPLGENPYYTECRNYIKSKEREFVNKKYHIALSSSEVIDNTNKVESNDVLVGACSNLDLEDGNLNSWTGTQGYNANSNLPFKPLTYLTSYNTNTPYDDCSYYTLITSTSAYKTDYYGGFPGISPNGGKYSARLGSEQMNLGNGYTPCPPIGSQAYYSSIAEELKQTFVVTPANALITYQYAVVLNDGGHELGVQPYFEAIVTKAGDTAALSTCTKYYQQIEAGVPPPGFIRSNYTAQYDYSYVYYRPWTYNSVNLTPYLGKTVTLKFIASGCAAGAHFGYAYVDATCGAAEIKASSNTPCAGKNITLTAPPVAGGTYSWTGPGIVGSNTSQNITVSASGTYSVTVTPGQGAACKYTLSIPVKFSNVTAPIASSTNISCNGLNNGSASVNASGGISAYTYSWSNGQTTSAATGLATGTYTIKVTDAGGCTNTNTVSITQPGALTTTVSSTSGGCKVANGTTSVNALGGTTAYSYSWLPGGQTTPKATGLSTGTYTMTLTDKNGCTKTNTVTVNSTAAPTATVSNVLPATCGNNSGSATASASGGTAGGYTYLWSPGGYTTPHVTGLGAGIYTVTITDPNGCSDTKTANVPNANGPSVNTTVTANVSCFGGNNGSAIAVPTGGTPAYTYLWSNGQTTSTATGLSAGTQVVTVTDINGCVAYFPAIITQPTFSLSATTATSNVSCNGGNNAAITLTPAGGTPFYTYLWSNGQTTKDLTGLSAGSYSVTIKDNNSCTIVTPVTISQPAAALTATVSSQTNVSCNSGNNAAAVLSASGGTPSYTYLWSNGQTTKNLTGLSAGNYSVTIKDNNGCPATASVTISQPSAALSSTVSSSNVSCNGGNNGTATLTPGGGTPGYTYAWSDGQTTKTATGLTADTYSATITDANGCPAAAWITISEPTVLTATFSLTHVSCNGQNSGEALLTPTGGTPGYTFLWNSGQTTKNITGLNAGFYSVDILDAHACSISKSFYIKQPAKALTVSTAVSGSSCGTSAQGIIMSSASNGTGPYTYLWSNGQTTQNLSHILGGDYTLTVTDANGCKEVSIPTVPVNTLPVADFSSAPAIACDGVHVKFTDASSNALTWNWTFGNAGSSAEQNPEFLFPYNGTYNVTLIVTNPPCADTVSIPLAFSDMSDYFKIAETNVFTPNDDKTNDCFVPVLTGMGADTLKDCLTLEVFDRWGVKMFESNATVKCWDGNNLKENKPALDGIYFYVAKLGKTTARGYVTLLRHK